MAESNLLWFISFFPLWTTPMILLNRNGDLSSLTRFPRILEISRWTCCLSHMLEQAMFSTYEYVVRIMTIYDVCSAYTNDNIIYIFRTKYTIWLSRATNGSNFHFFPYRFNYTTELLFQCNVFSFLSLSPYFFRFFFLVLAKTRTFYRHWKDWLLYLDTRWNSYSIRFRSSEVSSRVTVSLPH